MKKIFYIVLLTVISCKKPCDDINCGPHGTCNETSEACVCEAFYEGNRCQKEVRGRFVGEWSGKGVCNYNPGNFFNLDVEITKGLDVDGIKIQSANILQDFTITGILNEKNEVEIPEFKPNISTALFNGKIVSIDSLNIVLTLGTIINNNPATCEYTLKR